MSILNVDVVCGLAWGDEAKGKIVSELLKKNRKGKKARSLSMPRKRIIFFGKKGSNGRKGRKGRKGKRRTRINNCNGGAKTDPAIVVI